MFFEGERVAVVGFLRTAVAAAMSCFFGCFRIKDSHLVSQSEPVVSRNKNALSSLFICDDDSIRKGEEGQISLPEERDFTGLKDEAKFLKACGTLPETPVEIRKASKKWDEKKSLKFNSWLSNECPTPVKVCEESVTGAGSLEDTPISCMTDGHSSRRGSISSIQRGDKQSIVTPINVCDSETRSATSEVSPVVFDPSVQSKKKSVRFDSKSGGSSFSSKGSSSESSRQHSKQYGTPGSGSVSKPSPYPTPLKLTDEMQTPGTVFPAYMSNMADGKTTRIRSQYVYPVEKPTHMKELKVEISNPDQLTESLILNDEASTPISDSAMKDLSVGKEMKYEASLSSWLKPTSAKQDGNNEQFGSDSGENLHCGKTPGDRPILGMVAAHWKDDETSHLSPTMWDGNGIPNSTNKYKEDQKVSWHATPFEERLEKALSEETFISQRKPINGTQPVEFNEIEESDTALSHLQSPANLKSVVSF
ncbi:hypothetical protein ACJIZ3_010984 [Penstemon smallii]|uniref:Protein JASON n=1 Tax=Penstemon smallii TaxID=265156 RepID=A0ABD3UJA1_9LAMI